MHSQNQLHVAKTTQWELFNFCGILLPALSCGHSHSFLTYFHQNLSNIDFKSVFLFPFGFVYIDVYTPFAGVRWLPRSLRYNFRVWSRFGCYCTIYWRSLHLLLDIKLVLLVDLLVDLSSVHYWTSEQHRQPMSAGTVYATFVLDMAHNRKQCTVKPRFTVPRFTGSLDLPGLIAMPRKQSLCVNQCKIYPDIPCFSMYRT